MSETKTYLRTWTTLVRINTGPPTWWKPDLGIGRSGRVLILRAGWLRVCIQIGFGTKREDRMTNNAPVPDTSGRGSGERS